MDRGFKKGDKVFVPNKKLGYGDATGIIHKKSMPGLYKVKFINLPIGKNCYTDRNGKKVCYTTKKDDSYFIDSKYLRKLKSKK